MLMFTREGFLYIRLLQCADFLLLQAFGGDKRSPTQCGHAPHAAMRHWGAFCFRATPHNEAKAIAERFWLKLKFGKRRDTVCISSFSN